LSQDDYHKEFLRRLKAALQRLATTFLGQPLESEYLDRTLRRIIRKIVRDPERHFTRAVLLRKLINYDHTRPYKEV